MAPPILPLLLLDGNDLPTSHIPLLTFLALLDIGNFRQRSVEGPKHRHGAAIFAARNTATSTCPCFKERCGYEDES